MRRKRGSIECRLVSDRFRDILTVRIMILTNVAGQSLAKEDNLK